MPRLERWLVASKMVEVLDRDTIQAILDHGGQIGGGWCEVHQHILVNKDNKEQIEKLLASRGFAVSGATERKVFHPEVYRDHAPGGCP